MSGSTCNGGGGVCKSLKGHVFTPNSFFVCFHCEIIVMDGLNSSEAGFRMFQDLYVDLFKFYLADILPTTSS